MQQRRSKWLKYFETRLAFAQTIFFLLKKSRIFSRIEISFVSQGQLFIFSLLVGNMIAESEHATNKLMICVFGSFAIKLK